MADSVIRVDNLKKSYGTIEAVAGLSFDVREGEIFGMVGPNGAGKTTTIECIEGLRAPDSGAISVLGRDPQTEHQALKPLIGIQLQHSALQERIRVGEILSLYSALYDVRTDWKRLLSRLGLDGSEKQFFSKLSGGQQQRLFIALSLLHNPQLVFLDELTTGLDPKARRNIWALVKEIRDEGKTVYLTTHFMEEAELLCDRVAIVDGGRLVALDSPRALIEKLGSGRRLIFDAVIADLSGLKALSEVQSVEQSDNIVTVTGQDDRMIAQVVRWLVDESVAFRNLKTEQPTLEDVFLAVTGHDIEAGEEMR